jgi:hypothetical protein
MTKISDNVALCLGNRSEFVKELVKVLGVKENKLITTPLIIKEALEIIANICMKHKDEKRFIDSNKLLGVLSRIKTIAEKKNLVIIDQILTNLLLKYSTKIVQSAGALGSGLSHSNLKGMGNVNEFTKSRKNLYIQQHSCNKKHSNSQNDY